MKCVICDKELNFKEGIFCQSCVDFLTWKYGSLEAYEKARNKGVSK